MANVVIKRQVAAFNIDSYNRSVIHTAALPNGSIFVLNAKNNNESEVWDVTAPTEGATGVWMATSPEVIYVDKTHGGSVDPRDFTNPANKVFDASYLAVNDLWEMTGEGIANIATNGFLTAGTTTTLVSAATAPASGFYMQKVGTNTLKVGDGAIAPATVTTYIFEVKAN